MSAMKSVFRELRQAVLDGMAHSKDKLHQLADNLTDHLDNLIRQVRGIDTFDGSDLSTPSVRPYNPIRGDDGLYRPGSLPSKDDLMILTRTDPDTTFYWSGRDRNGVSVGPNGSKVAETIATANDGQTLEQLLKKNGVSPLPEWDELDPESVRFWEDASAAYAQNASGEVRAVLGSDLRVGNVWETVEVPQLLNNPNVTTINVVDPDTGIWAPL